MGVTNLKQRMPFRRWQFVGRAVAAAAFAKSQRTIVRHKMFREKIFRRPKPLGEEAPETPPADFRAETVKTLNEPFGVFARGLVYFGGNFEPIPDRCNFAEGTPVCVIPKGPGFIPMKMTRLRLPPYFFKYNSCGARA
jgi:hypothetical protein